MTFKGLQLYVQKTITFLTPFLWLSLLPFLFYRKLFKINNQAYEWNGTFGCLFLAFIVMILLGSLDQLNLDQHPSIQKMIGSSIRSTFFQGSLVIVTILIATSLDPWLRNSLVLGVISKFGIYLVIFFGVLNFIFIRKFSDLHTSSVGVWDSFADIFSKNWATNLLVLSISAIGLYLRLRNLSGPSPTVDEFPHFVNAIAILEGKPVEYLRAFWTVTVPVAFSYKLFGISITTARLPMVILNMAAVFPLYAFMKRFGRWYAILSVFLYSVNPSIIAMSQITRDYAPAPIFIFSVFLITSDLLLIEIKHGIRKALFREKKQIIFLFILFVFVMSDQNSISSVVIANFAGFIFAFVLKALFEYQKDRKRLLAAVGFAIVSLAIIVAFFDPDKLHFDAISIKSKYLAILTSDPYANWSHYFPWISYLIIGFLVFELYQYFFVEKSFKDHLFLYSTFVLVGLFAYTTLFLFTDKLGARTRYYVVFVYYMVPVFTIFFVRIFIFILKHLRSQTLGLSLLVPTAIFLLMVNIPAYQKLAKFTYGNNPISNTPHYDYTGAYSYLQANFSDNDILVSDQIHKYDSIQDRMFSEQYVIPIKTIKKNSLSIDEAIQGYEQGWIVKSRNSGIKPFGLKFRDLDTEENAFTFVGVFNSDVAIWHFQKK